MNINFDACGNDIPLFDTEVDYAIEWLFKIFNANTNGWGWIPHIPSNEQNTAEVVCALIRYHEKLDDSQKERLSSAVKTWFIEPANNAEITIDWAWVLRALNKIKPHIGTVINGISLNELSKSIADCNEWLLANQNTDGGWSDVKGDLSSVTRTAVAIIGLSSNSTIDYNIKNSIDTAVEWILSIQNADGGWGNVRQLEIQRLTSQGSLHI